MKIRRILALTKKELKRTIREPAVLFMIFLFPIVFVVAFGASFGGFGGGSTVTYQIGVVNYDTGAHSQTFLNDLTSTKIVNLSVYADNATAQNDLSQGKMQALILIPDGFSGSVNSYNTAPANAAKWTNTTVQLYLDKGSLVATQAVPPIIQQTVNAMLNQQSLQSPIQLSTASLVEVKQFSALDFIAPGMFTFASIFLIMIVAQSFTGDRENGMMKRIRISPITPAEFMSSLVLSYLVIALIQAVLLFGITYAMGFRPAEHSSIPLHLHNRAHLQRLKHRLRLNHRNHRKSSSAATGLSFLFVLPQMFLGTFVASSLAGAAQTASLIAPSHYVTDALTSLFLRGASIASASVLIDFAVVCTSCIGILAVGIVLYAKRFKI
jgi:ABC-2 type transport system permease protein